jgi:Gamma tubulin complex component C-terminal
MKPRLCDLSELTRDGVVQRSPAGCMQIGAALNRFMRESAHLQAHLAAIEHYVLLGRGDFVRDFLDAAAGTLRLSPQEATAATDLQKPFAAAAAKTGIDADPFFAHVSLTWHKELPQPEYMTNKVPVIPSATSAEPGAPSWNSIQLSYAPPWPLPLLLNRARLSLYEALSTYLLAVERAQHALDDAWQHLMTQRRASRRGPRHAAWALHQRLAHFMRHLHLFLKDDVIARGFEVMRGEIEAAGTFEQVEAAHERLQERLRALTFLSHASVCEKLQSVLQQCTLLCRCAARLDLLQMPAKFPQLCMLTLEST